MKLHADARTTPHARRLMVRRVLEQAKPVKDVCREHGFGGGTYYRWKAKYGGLGISEARRLKELERENRRLKSAVAELTLDNQALKEVVSRKR